jgi:sugar phosphate isomerase/epimerase
MSDDRSIPAALAIDGLSGDARGAFDLASSARYRGISFATNHAELTPDQLGQSARRHLRTTLSSRHLAIEAIRVAAPRGALTDAETIDRTMDNARKAFLLAADLGVKTVALNVGNLGTSKVPESTIVAAVRDLAQHADAAGLSLALGSEGAQHLRGLVKDVDYERATVNFDAARLIEAGDDPLKTAEEMAGIIGQVTASDAIRAGKSVRATFLGEGQLPLPELMAILDEQGFRGPLVVDVRELSDGAAGARHAAEVLDRLLRK